MGMIFQSYALFPHRTVAENVAFGLRMRGLGKDEIDERVTPGAAPGRARRLRGPPPGAALRRPAAARRAGARDRDPAARAAVRRAARRARPQAAAEHAVRAEAAAAAARRHADLRDARSGRGDDDLGPHRRDERRPDRADRHARAKSTIARARASSPTSSARSICSKASGTTARLSRRAQVAGAGAASGPAAARSRSVPSACG